MRHYILASWFFFIMNATGDPQWQPADFKTQADCDAARAWVLAAKKITDQAAGAAVVSPCYQSYTVVQ